LDRLRECHNEKKYTLNFEISRLQGKIDQISEIIDFFNSAESGAISKIEFLNGFGKT
jgi:hypothetical protein